LQVLGSFKNEWEAKFWLSLQTPQRQKAWVRAQVDALVAREEFEDLRESVEEMDWHGGGKLTRKLSLT